MDDAVERLARTLWEKAGQPEGRDVEFWLAAEKLVDADKQRDARTRPPAADVMDGLHPAAVVGGD